MPRAMPIACSSARRAGSVSFAASSGKSLARVDLAEELPQVLHQQDPVEGVGRGAFEAEAVVEAACPLFRVGDERTDAN